MNVRRRTLKRKNTEFKASGGRMCVSIESKETVDGFHFPFSRDHLIDHILRYLRMLKRMSKRSSEQNLTNDQLAKWYDMEKGKLGKTRIDRLSIWLTVWWNLVFATFVCLMVASKKNVPPSWLLRLQVVSSDICIDDLVSRHKVIPEKVELFMCLEDVLNIPIVVSKSKGVFYIDDGHHRHKARQKKGFKKIRAILI
jgi:hypothetical protein